MDREAIALPFGHAGRRLETVLGALLPSLGKGELCRLLRTGLVRVSGRREQPGRRLGEGETLDVPPWLLAAEQAGEPPPPARRAPKGSACALDVHYEDDDVLIVNKPAMLASHGGIGHAADNLASRLVSHCAKGTAAPGTTAPGLAQRLDVGVSGLLACGKHPLALKGLMGPPHGPPLVKVYLAVVAGQPTAEAGTITLPLRVTDQPRGDAPKTVVDRIAGRPARTDYVVLKRQRAVSLLALRLETGRTHQIRAHLRGIGHPLAGDARYGLPVLNAQLHETYGTARPLLHAVYLAFTHPCRPQVRPAAAAPVPRALSCALGADAEALWQAAVKRGRLAALGVTELPSAARESASERA